MAQLFSSHDVEKIFFDKFVVIIGDSNQRSVYKDLVLLMQQNRYLCREELRSKGEFSFLSDELVEGGRKGVMCNGISYKEVRQFQTDSTVVRFYFVTRCYNSYMESILNDLKEEPHPDLILMNSCLWDMTRYGKGAITAYKEHMVTAMSRFCEVLPQSCLKIWNTTLPISSSAKGGLLIPEIQFLSTTLRLDIIEANYYAKLVAMDHDFDVLDFHYHLRRTLGRRVQDGIHWDMYAHRHLTNLLLTHVCQAWGMPTPLSRGQIERCAGDIQFNLNQSQLMSQMLPLMYTQMMQMQSSQVKLREKNQMIHQGHEPRRSNMHGCYRQQEPAMWNEAFHCDDVIGRPYEGNSFQGSVRSSVSARRNPMGEQNRQNCRDGFFYSPVPIRQAPYCGQSQQGSHRFYNGNFQHNQYMGTF